jgi:hypothetical protein
LSKLPAFVLNGNICELRPKCLFSFAKWIKLREYRVAKIQLNFKVHAIFESEDHNAFWEAITTLKLSDVISPSDLIPKLTFSHKLTSLIVAAKYSCEQLIEIILGLPKLVHLDIGQCCNGDKTVLISIVSRFRHLKYLNMSRGSKNITNDTMNYFFKICPPEFNHLTHLNISQSKLNEKSIAQILDRFPSLEYLDVTACGLLSESILTDIIVSKTKLNTFNSSTISIDKINKTLKLHFSITLNDILDPTQQVLHLLQEYETDLTVLFRDRYWFNFNVHNIVPLEVCTIFYKFVNALPKNVTKLKFGPPSRYYFKYNNVVEITSFNFQLLISKYSNTIKHLHIDSYILPLDFKFAVDNCHEIEIISFQHWYNGGNNRTPQQSLNYITLESLPKFRQIEFDEKQFQNNYNFPTELTNRHLILERLKYRLPSVNIVEECREYIATNDDGSDEEEEEEEEEEYEGLHYKMVMIPVVLKTGGELLSSHVCSIC